MKIQIERMFLKIGDCFWYNDTGYNCPIIITQINKSTKHIQYKTLSDMMSHDYFIEANILNDKFSITHRDDVIQYLLKMSKNNNSEISKIKMNLQEKEKMKNKISDVLHNLLSEAVRMD